MNKKYVLVCMDMRGEYVNPLYDVFVSEDKAEVVEEMWKHFQSDIESLVESGYNVSHNGDSGIIECDVALEKVVGLTYEDMGEPTRISLINVEGEAITYVIKSVEK